MQYSPYGGQHRALGSSASLSHELRTAAEPRQNRLHSFRLSYVEQINTAVRLIRLSLPPIGEPDEDESNRQGQEPFTFLPGQWLDVHIPSISQAGGFTITSTPADARPLPLPEALSAFQPLSPKAEGVSLVDAYGRSPYVELAVQASPFSLPAAWLWRPKDEILGKALAVRVGGSFVWPPSGIPMGGIRNLMFVAGGVGVNPLISILSHITEIGLSTSSSSRETLSIHFLYSSRVPTLPSTSPSESSPSGSQNVDQESLNRILFLPRLRQIVQRSCPDYSLSDRQRQVPPRFRIYLNLFLTNLASFQDVAWPDMWIRSRRISEEDLVAAATDPDTVCYVCGPPPMTDNFVDVLGQIVGAERVFHERWW